jgi:hypothetical protein
VLVVLSLLNPHTAWVRYSVRSAAISAAAANALGVADMTRLGAFCFYCLLTTILAPVLVWAAFVL